MTLRENALALADLGVVAFENELVTSADDRNLDVWWQLDDVDGRQFAD